MSRLIIKVSFLSLCACDPTASDVDFEHEVKERHTLEELVALHESAVAAQGKDIYFIQPIGRFGKSGVQASLDHIASKGESPATYNNMELIFGVAVYAKQATGYVMCEDPAMIRRLTDLAGQKETSPSGVSKFDSALASFCEAGETPLNFDD